MTLSFRVFFFNSQCTAKHKDFRKPEDFSLKFCTTVINMSLYIMYYIFDDFSHFYSFSSFNVYFYRHSFIKKHSAKFCGSNPKKENARQTFCRSLYIIFHSSSTSYILVVFENWRGFDPKLHDMTSLKLHLLKNFSTNFAEILCDGPD